MNTAARIAVARDSAVPAPRAPNTVPEAPAPKPAPASAPLPRWISTSADDATAADELHDSQNRYATSANCSTDGYCRGPSAAAAARMVRNSSAFSEAPPISPPSTSGIANSSRRIARLDAAAVEDTNRSGNFSILLRQVRPRMKAWTSWACSGVAVTPGADGPDRLVGDHGPAKARSIPQQLHHRLQLPRDHLQRPAGLALGQLLAHAQDRHQPCVRAAANLRATSWSSLAVQHSAARSGRRSRTGSRHPCSIAAETSPVKAPWASAHTSCAPRLNRRVAQQARRLPPGTRTAGTPRRSPLAAGNAVASSSSTSRAFSAARAVHFPVAGDQGLSHESTSNLRHEAA